MSEDEYEHAGVWDCEGCGASFRVETKMDPLAEAMACPDHLHPVDGETNDA